MSCRVWTRDTQTRLKIVVNVGNKWGELGELPVGRSGAFRAGMGRTLCPLPALLEK